MYYLFRFSDDEFGLYELVFMTSDDLSIYEDDVAFYQNYVSSTFSDDPDAVFVYDMSSCGASCVEYSTPALFLSCVSVSPVPEHIYNFFRDCGLLHFGLDILDSFHYYVDVLRALDAAESGTE